MSAPRNIVFAIKMIAIVGLAGPLAGCGSSLKAVMDTASLKPTTAPAAPLNGELPSYNGTPVALYTLIARGANKCWLAPERPLHGSHLFRANASSDLKKGEPSIVIYERDKSAKPEKRIAALRINIKSVSAGQSSVSLINRRFPVPIAQQMTVDVQRWASGKLTCSAPPAPLQSGSTDNQSSSPTSRPAR